MSSVPILLCALVRMPGYGLLFVLLKTMRYIPQRRLLYSLRSNQGLRRRSNHSFRPMNASFQDLLILCSMVVRRSFLRGAQARVTLQSEVHDNARAKGLLLWQRLVLLIAPLSATLQEILESSASRSLLSQLVASVADTTLIRYVQSCLQYFALLRDLGFDACSISQVQAYDVMIQLYRSPEDEEEVPTSCFPLNTLKALRWMSKVASISFPDLPIVGHPALVGR